MKKAVFTIILTIFLIGCAGTSQTYTYRPPGNNQPMWIIEGKADFGSGELEIFINHEPVISGKLDFWSADGVFHGSYKELPVSANCKYHPQFFSTSYEECTVMINGELAAIVRIEQPGG